jgi:peptidoglycan/xylan/chitin deacetylase (PgdA/CDA1 family)
MMPDLPPAAPVSFRAAWRDRLACLVAVAVLLGHRAGAGRTGLVLVYHRLAAAPGDPDRELLPAVALDAFRAQMAWLRRWYAPVPAQDILEAATSRRRWRRYPVAVTFDDDSAAYLPAAVPALEAAGIRATFFVSGASLDGPFAFWWERLQMAYDQGLDVASVVGVGRIHATASRLEAVAAPERDATADALAHLGAAPQDAGLPAADLRALARRHEIGFHTRRHDRLDRLDDDALRTAMAAGRGRLEAEAGRPLKAIAYPHGVAGPRETSAARSAGFERGFVMEPLPVRPATDPMRIGRAEIGHGLLGRFALRLERALGRSAPRP